MNIVLPAVLVLGAVGGGLAYTKSRIDGADRVAPTVLWTDAGRKPVEDPAEGFAKGRASTPLSKLLLPVPESYRLGPDIDGRGNDTEISARDATALIKESGRGLAGKQRRDFDRNVDKMGVQGVAMRSYSAYHDNLVVEVQITRMKDRRKIKDLYKLRTDLADFFEMSAGPRIKGHKNSACYMNAPVGSGGKKTDLDGLTCLAYEGDVQVTVSAYGPKPLDKAEVADLVRQQLDHIASPGEYV
ncbi:hypothetical protein [Streptomyces sp. NPDC047928]|uniref:hypothetical protein n=1 Tax=unclassified Streptomyces TaxID=2593676 RepID=UPI00371134F2